MTPASQDLAILQEFYADKLRQVLRHQAAARLVTQYDANNTYQYVINREETELSWLQQAIVEMGGSVPGADQHEPDRGGGRKKADAARDAMTEDIRDAQEFVDRWRPRIDTMTNARHARMLRLIVGEMLEQKRFFEQALAGRTDLLGRRGAQLEPAHGEVLPTRWIE